MELPAELTELIKKKRFEEIEDVWMRRLEESPEEIDFFHLLARDLARAGEKKRAVFLLQLLAQVHRDREDWKSTLEVLSKAASLKTESEGLREETHDALRRCYPDRPHFEQFVSLTGLLGSSPTHQAIEAMERLLAFDEGRFFELRGRGVGKVVEVRPADERIRLRFGAHDELTLKIDEARRVLTPLSDDHFLVRREKEGEELRALARTEPARLLELLFQSAGRSLSAREIREQLAGLIPAESWSRWWGQVKALPQLLTTSGPRVRYQWRSSPEDADQAIREEFEGASLAGKINLARRHAGRGESLDRCFLEGLVAAASRSLADSPPAALEAHLLAEELGGGPPGGVEAPSTTSLVERLLSANSPADLALGVTDPKIRRRALLAIRQVRPDSWVEVLAQVFLRTDDARTLDYAYQELGRSEVPEGNVELVEVVLASPRRYPRQFLWVLRQASGSSQLRDRLDRRTLRTLIEAYQAEEFRPWKQNLLSLLDEHDLMAAALTRAGSTEARKVLALLEGDCGLPNHRRARLRKVIRLSFPQLEEKEETFYVTSEALARKREEYRQLREAEIPKNSADIGRAAALGDLSENHEYKAAREKQLLLMSQARALGEELEQARTIDPATVPRDKVGIGSRLHLQETGGAEERVVTVLGPWDSDPDRHVYSYLSPLGGDLLDRVAGDVVELEGREYRIGSLSVWADDTG